jgi:hypothetical protein
VTDKWGNAGPFKPVALPAPGVVGVFQHKPDVVHGVQFDGTVGNLNLIFSAVTSSVGTAGVQLTIFFGTDQLVDSVSVTGGQLDGGIAFNRHDWVLVPQDGSNLFVMTDAEMQANWEDAAP